MAATNLNVLQRHVSFFDQNHDGIIYPADTFQGFPAIGSGILLSYIATIFINVGLSGKTRTGEPFSKDFPIEIQNINFAKHTSDSGVFDCGGRFIESKFEEIFTNNTHTRPVALTSFELEGFLQSNRQPKDYGGWLAGYMEWKILYMLGKDKDGFLPKDTVRAACDGSLFEKLSRGKMSRKEEKI
ncbi:probable peroxygenase 4 [Primulina eburnea]|uniref:probable peroxygenase 4 n=1 Tax=Primulina eburnea TaxID=1245227 RepID=UPI003C6C57B6